MTRSRGRLDVVATPIGNLADLSQRAREALAGADLVAAEDTRHTGQLLATLGIARPLVSLHAHNETRRVDELLERLQAGATVALASDAGTPLVSDPGASLVARAAAAGIEIRAIPGPSAVIAALCVAGLPTERFAFEGFLPAKAGERRERLASLAGESRTLVFFEAPHRIVAALADCVAAFGPERPAALCRELTKAFETVYRGSLAQLADLAQTEANLARGELTLVVAGAAAATRGAHDARLLRRAVMLLSKELPPGKVASIASQLCGATRSDAYAATLALAREGAPGAKD
jgi:16S rRNA (cytidine1402-2'-O)-methyltransferase